MYHISYVSKYISILLNILYIFYLLYSSSPICVLGLAPSFSSSFTMSSRP